MRTSEIRHRKITQTVTRQYDLFVSYNRNDSTRASHFARELEKRGVRVWMDKLNLAPGDLWQTEIANALEHATAIAVLIGPSGLGGWQELEMQMALAKQPERKLRIVPVPLPGAARALTLPDLLAPFMHCDLRADNRSQQLDMLAEVILAERERDSDTPPIAEPAPSWLSTLFRVAGKSLVRQEAAAAPREPVQLQAARAPNWPNERSASVERVPAAPIASKWQFTGQELDDLLHELESGTPTHSARDSYIRDTLEPKKQAWVIGPTGSIKSITTEQESPLPAQEETNAETD
jgi:hypothetical protein